MDPWYSSIPDTVTVEHQGAQIPLREHPFVKETPDLATFAKRGFDAHREIGSRIPLKVSKPEEAEAWKKEHLPKLYQAGILQPPPASPDEYGVAKPEAIPDGLGWDDEAAKEFAAVLHKHGAPKALAAELLGLHQKMLTKLQVGFKTAEAEGLAKLKAEHGADFDKKMETGKRLVSTIFKTPEEMALFDALGLGNHPGFLSVLLRLAPLAEQDSAFLQDASRPTAGGAMSKDEVFEEEKKSRTDPKHPMYEDFKKGTRKWTEWRDGLYAKAFPNSPAVRFGQGITIGDGGNIS